MAINMTYHTFLQCCTYLSISFIKEYQCFLTNKMYFFLIKLLAIKYKSILTIILLTKRYLVKRFNSKDSKQIDEILEIIKILN